MHNNIPLSCLTTLIFFWTAKGVIIDNCNDNRRVVLENTRVVLSCGEIAGYNVWCDVKMQLIATCDPWGKCTDDTELVYKQKLDYQFSRNSTHSQLVIPQGFNRSYPSQSFTCEARGSKYTCQLIIKIKENQTKTSKAFTTSPRGGQENKTKTSKAFTSSPRRETETLPFTNTTDTSAKQELLAVFKVSKVAAIVVASGIGAAILVIGTIVFIKRKGYIYHKPTQINLDEHPYTTVLTSQHPTTSGGSVQENELRSSYVNVCRYGNPRY